MLEIMLGDIFEVLPSQKDFEFHTILSDLPYNLGTKWIIGSDGKPKVKGKSADFMGKWEGLDGAALETMFREFYRVLKKGGYCVVFGLDRQLMPFLYYAVLAGFEVCQSLYWYQVSGFPKATDIGKAIDKRLGMEREVVGKKTKARAEGQSSALPTMGAKTEYIEFDITAPASELAKKYDGYKGGIAPFKPCLETVLVLRKGFDGGIVDAVLRAENDDTVSPPVVNIDGGRVGCENKPFPSSRRYAPGQMAGGCGNLQGQTEKAIDNNPSGRYPSQLFVDSEAAREIDKWQSTKAQNPHPTVKPITLIKKIMDLFRLPSECNQKILIPFSGSGSEIIGCQKAGIKNITAIEISKEYCDIAEARIKYWETHDFAEINNEVFDGRQETLW